MAEGKGLQESLFKEGMCPICREYCICPVTLDCGHNFCSNCIDRLVNFSVGRPKCPLCKEEVQTETLRPNKQLGNILEVVQDMNNLLKCRHEYSVEDAEKKFAKCQIDHGLKILRKGRDDILGYIAESHRASKSMLDLIDKNMKDTTSALKKFHMALKKQEKKLLIQTELLKNDIEKRRNELVAILHGEISSLDKCIQKAKTKLQWHSGSELLKISGDILESSKKKSFEIPLVFPVELMWRIYDSSDINLFLEGIMKKFKESLESGLQLHEANVKLEPDHLDPLLILSKDLKSVRCKDTQEYSEMPYVLGQEGFTAGRHFWEVAVSNEEVWSVGVAIQPVNRTNYDEDQILEMEMRGKTYNVFNFSDLEETDPYVNSKQLKKIRVIVNCGAREVGFYNAETGEKLTVEFVYVPFDRVVFKPFFSVSRKGSLTLCPHIDGSIESGNQPHQFPRGAFA